MTIAREYARHCSTVAYEDLSDEVVDWAKKHVLDTVGNAVGGYHWSDSGETVLGAARDLHGDADAGSATVLATGDRLPPQLAALVNGTLAHSLDYDNRHSAGSLHVGSAVVTAALAAAEAADADGETFLSGVVAGYDVSARLGMACNPRSSHERGFHPTGACGSFGATAAVGTIYGLDVEDLRTAFGINGSQASGSYQCSLTGGWNKRLHPGLAAKNAFVSVALATNGFTSAEAPIEGDLGFLQAYADRPRPERATEGLGEVFEVTRTKIKPYPLGTFTHVPIALLVELVAETTLDPTDVREVTVEMPTSGAKLFGRAPGVGHPTSAVEAQFDMPFAAALSLVYGEVGLGTFDDALAEDYPGEFGRLMDVTTTVGSDELEGLLPDLYPARVTVRTRSRRYERYREWVEGEPDHPMSWTDLERKVRDLTVALDEQARADAVARIRNVESVTGRDLTAPFRG